MTCLADESFKKYDSIGKKLSTKIVGSSSCYREMQTIIQTLKSEIVRLSYESDLVLLVCSYVFSHVFEIK